MAQSKPIQTQEAIDQQHRAQVWAQIADKKIKAARFSEREIVLLLYDDTEFRVVLHLRDDRDYGADAWLQYDAQSTEDRWPFRAQQKNGEQA